MRILCASAILAGTLALAPAAALAQSSAKPAQTAPKPAAQAAKKSTAKAAASHTTTGVVKSVDASSLVISRSGKNAGDMTFTLDPSTHREGAVEVGSTVSVRYRQEGQTNTATAITAQHAKQQAARKPAASK